MAPPERALPTHYGHTPLALLAFSALQPGMRSSLFPFGLTSLSPMDIPSYSHLGFTSLLPCPQRHGPAFNGVCYLFIWRMAPCEYVILLLFGPMVPLCLLLWPYVAFFLWLSWPYMASFMATTPAVLSIRLHLPCNLGIHYLLALKAPAFAVSGRLQPFLESWGCSLFSSACLSQHWSVDCVYSP